jgi:2,4-diketo-3-deoxy-L-fuconate hydrolase
VIGRSERLLKFATVRHRGEARLSVVDQDGFAILPREIGDLVDLIVDGERGLDRVTQSLPNCEVIAPTEVEVLAPLQRFRRDILCTGLNYSDHFEEGIGLRGDYEVDRPEHPTFFTKGPDTVIGPYDDICFDPSLSQRWDYEAEIALVIGIAGRSIPESEAMSHVWGFTLANDITQRDVQRAHGGQWLKGKSIDNTMPIGPWMVTRDEIDLDNVQLECRLNGETMQSASLSQMEFKVPRLLAELSWGMTLRPGDVLLTGTPSGVGHARVPQVYLSAGDELVVSATGMGELRNVIAEGSLTEYQFFR